MRHLAHQILLAAPGLALLLLNRAVAAPTAASAPKPAVETVVIVFKTHFDIGYTDLASNVVRRYRTTMIDDALKVVDQNRNLPPAQQFAWTLPGWPLSKIAEDWPGQTPERKRRVWEAFKDGRFVVHALPFTLHTELLEPEDLVRGLGFASRLSKAAALPLPRDAKMTDVPCHAWIMPTLLRHAGVDFLHLGCNAASSSPQVPRLFFWEGPDGSRLLTMYTAESYGTGLVPPNDWPYKTWLALVHTGDNHGPPTPAEVKKLLDEAAKKLPGVKVRIGRLSDFADGILAEKAQIPVIRGDMPDTWIHGPMCDPQGAKLARNIRPAITTAELLNSHLRAWGVPAPDLSRTVADAWEQSLLYGEHTWGGAQYWVTKYGTGTKWGYGETWRRDHQAKRFQRLEDSWAEHTAYIQTAQRLIEPALQDQMKALAEAVAHEGSRIVVFNPLPWQRQDEIAMADVRGTALGTPASGRLLAPDEPRLGSRGYMCDGQEMRLRVAEVGPLGYRTLVPGVPASGAERRPEIRAEAGELRAKDLTARLDPRRGTILSLKTGAGQELVDAASPFGFGQVLYERFDSNQVAAYVRSYVKISADWAVNELGKPSMPPAAEAPYRAASPTNFTTRYDVPGQFLGAEAVMEAPPDAQVPFGVTTRIILYAHKPYCDLEVTLHKKPADPWPEAAWICLPFKVENPQFRLGRQASVVDPTRDLVAGANRHLYAVETGVAVFDGQGCGAAVCPLDSPLVSLDRPGCWLYSRDFEPKKPVVFINLFNNQWTTNFRLWNEGTWTSRVRLWAFDRFNAERHLIQPSLEARFPLQAACAGGKPGGLPVSGSGLGIARGPDGPAGLDDPRKATPWRQDVLVTACGPNLDGPGTVLRLWELAGEAGPCQVRLPAGMTAKAAQPVDLRGQPVGKPIGVADGVFAAPLKGFAPATFVLQP